MLRLTPLRLGMEAGPLLRGASQDGSRAAFLAAIALAFAVSAAATVAWCRSMADMGGPPLPGGGTVPLAWLAACGPTWPGAAASFVGMWSAMTVAMMLPSLAPPLWRYRQAQPGIDGTQRGVLTVCVAGGCFTVWTGLGIAVFAAFAAVAQASLRWPSLAHVAAVAAGPALLIAGAVQFTAWKARHLACCRAIAAHRQDLRAAPMAALRHGLRLGVHCCQSCAGPTVALLAMGVMDLRVMAVVTLAITAERLAPAGERIAHATGAVSMGLGAWMIAGTGWPG